MKQVLKAFVLSIISLILSCSTIHAGEYYYSYYGNHQGYSVTTSTINNAIVVAGSICQFPHDCKIFVQSTDPSGNIQWRKEYDLGLESERCFKITNTMNGYILTGYAYDAQQHYTFVMEIDLVGNILWSALYNIPSSVGLDIIRCSDGSGYVVAGYMTAIPGEASPSRTGYIMKINPMGIIMWNRLFDANTNGQDFDMAEHVIEIPGHAVNGSPMLHYYVTGSTTLAYYNNGTPVNEQKVLSLMLDDNGNIAWEHSFSSGAWGSHLTNYETGVSAWYDFVQQKIYHVSNSEAKHGFFISTISPATGFVTGHQYVSSSNPATACKLSAYHIIEKDANTVTVGGFIHDYDWGSGGTHENPTFIVDINKFSLMPGNINVFEITSSNHHTYFADWLGTPWNANAPTIHTPAMFAKQDATNLWLVCYKQYSTSWNPNYDLALVNVNPGTYHGACDPMTYESSYGSENTFNFYLHYSSQHNYHHVTFTDNAPSYQRYTCGINNDPPAAKPTAVTNINTQNEDRLSIYPSPASDHINVRMYDQQLKNVIILDALGRETNIKYSGNSILNIAQLPAGLYMVKAITINNETFTKSFVKE